MNVAYITGVGTFLPGEPVSNTNIEHFIPPIHPLSARLKRAALRKNGIRQRHYALGCDGTHRYTNAAMAARAVQAAADAACCSPDSLDLLVTSTTQGDSLVPGFASAVHAELGIGPLEVASFQSVCASSFMALKAAYLQIKAGEAERAAVSGSEFSSRWFQPGFYQSFYDENMEREQAMSLEFLRWTLSDGAGAVILERQPRRGALSLRLDWLELRSFADRFPACMYAGSTNNQPDALPWSLYSSPAAAYAAGALALKQDFELLYRMFPTWIGYYLEILDKHGLHPQQFDYFLPHYSARSLGEEMQRLLERSGAMIPAERWFNNLETRGNTGTASIFVMLADLVQKQSLEPGQTILCFVPESGRCIASFAHLTVVEEK